MSIVSFNLFSVQHRLANKEKLFLDLTARNDWASTLAYTEHEKAGFAYPSVGLSILLDKWVKLPEWISFAKLRGAYSKVGNDIPVFVTNSASHISAGGEIQAMMPLLSKIWSRK